MAQAAEGVEVEVEVEVAQEFQVLLAPQEALRQADRVALFAVRVRARVLAPESASQLEAPRVRES